MKRWELSKYMAEMGKKGGKSRAKNLTAKQRQEIAAKGAKARWAKRKEEGK